VTRLRRIRALTLDPRHWVQGYIITVNINNEINEGKINKQIIKQKFCSFA